MANTKGPHGRRGREERRGPQEFDDGRAAGDRYGVRGVARPRRAQPRWPTRGRPRAAPSLRGGAARAIRGLPAAEPPCTFGSTRAILRRKGEIGGPPRQRSKHIPMTAATGGPRNSQESAETTGISHSEGSIGSPRGGNNRAVQPRPVWFQPTRAPRTVATPRRSTQAEHQHAQRGNMGMTSETRGQGLTKCPQIWMTGECAPASPCRTSGLEHRRGNWGMIRIHDEAHDVHTRTPARREEELPAPPGCGRFALRRKCDWPLRGGSVPAGRSRPPTRTSTRESAGKDSGKPPPERREAACRRAGGRQTEQLASQPPPASSERRASRKRPETRRQPVD